ncbi:hypothetical protein LTR56_024520 [Elasticomyces elasticus]|nr:hypothetical protein LTR56_024520 [Elasticomyces elasticus]KAK3620994.1 hypothetical protein LTR22_025383 [Elasticomyces elasticus]
MHIGDFLLHVQGNDSKKRISLLLFQAVMFAATAYSDMWLVTGKGYSDRKSMRQMFFQKVKLLYDFGYECDRLTIVQALLLMTYWYGTLDDQKDAWHWIGLAVSSAFDLGLHHSAAHSIADEKRLRLRKRLWWCCVVRDRLLALSMRKPPRIKNEDFDVPMLGLDDFDFQPLPPALAHVHGEFNSATNPANRRNLAKLCIEQARLCVCIGDVLSVQYLAFGEASSSDDEGVVRLKPRGHSRAAGSSQVIECDQELEQWRHDLPADCQQRTPRTEDSTEGHDCDHIFVHRLLLFMIYSATVSALHRPQVRSDMATDLMAKSLENVSRQRIKTAAIDVTRSAQQLEDRNLTRFLPPIGVAVLMPAIMLHLLESKSNDALVKDVGFDRFYQCQRILQRLQESYTSAHVAFSLVELAKAKVAPETRAESQQGRLHLKSYSTEEKNVPVPLPDICCAQGTQGSEQEAGEVGETSPQEQFRHLATPYSTSIGAGNEGSQTAIWEFIDNDFDALVNFDAWPRYSQAATGTFWDVDTGHISDISHFDT